MLDRLPLAITQAGAFLAQSKVRIDQYLNLFSSRQEDIATQLQDQGERILDRATAWPNGAGPSIAITWSISYETIKREYNKAADLLHLLAFLDHEISVDNDIINRLIGGGTRSGGKNIPFRIHRY